MMTYPTIELNSEPSPSATEMADVASSNVVAGIIVVFVLESTPPSRNNFIQGIWEAYYNHDFIIRIPYCLPGLRQTT